MALISLAIVGKDNEPLYLRDFQKEIISPSIDYESSMIKMEKKDDIAEEGPEGNKGDDPFGFFSGNNRPGESSSLRHQFLFHAALDRFEEITSTGSKWRSPGSSGSDAMWVGLLCPMEELRIYGYLTNTSIKIMAMIQDTMETSQQIATRDTELKLFFASIHELYVEYMLNPFSNIKSKIVSRRFDEGIRQSVNVCNKKYTLSDDMGWV